MRRNPDGRLWNAGLGAAAWQRTGPKNEKARSEEGRAGQSARAGLEGGEDAEVESDWPDFLGAVVVAAFDFDLRCIVAGLEAE